MPRFDPFFLSPTLFERVFWRTAAGAFLPGAAVVDSAGMTPVYRYDLIGQPLLVVDNTRASAGRGE